jgi:hypothetical protein
MKLTRKMLALCVAMCCALLVLAPAASALVIGDSRALGYIAFGIPAGDEKITEYLNYLIDMDLGDAGEVALGQTFTRSMNNFGELEDAVLASRTSYGDMDESTVSVDLGDTGYLYLMAKYDGPNYGTVAWYVGNLTGNITIPSGAGGKTGNKYGISGIALFNPGEDDSPPVPDGGATVLLLGAALTSLRCAALRFRR